MRFPSQGAWVKSGSLFPPGPSLASFNLLQPQSEGASLDLGLWPLLGAATVLCRLYAVSQPKSISAWPWGRRFGNLNPGVAEPSSLYLRTRKCPWCPRHTPLGALLSPSLPGETGPPMILQNGVQFLVDREPGAWSGHPLWSGTRREELYHPVYRYPATLNFQVGSSGIRYPH